MRALFSPLLLSLALTLTGCGSSALPIALKALAAVSALGAEHARSESGGCQEGPSALDGGAVLGVPGTADAGADGADGD